MPTLDVFEWNDLEVGGVDTPRVDESYEDGKPGMSMLGKWMGCSGRRQIPGWCCVATTAAIAERRHSGEEIGGLIGEKVRQQRQT